LRHYNTQQITAPRRK